MVLVGHSMGGIVTSEAAERRPEKIRMLVYLTAYLLPSGRSVLDAAQTDEETLVLPNMVVDEEKGIVTIRKDAAKDIFNGDCSEDEARKAIERVIPDPLAPFATPVSVSEENFGRVRRTYIECLRDRAIGPTTQWRMYTELPCEKVVSMDTSHSPYLSAPEELVRHLMSLDPSQARQRSYPPNILLHQDRGYADFRELRFPEYSEGDFQPLTNSACQVAP